MDGPGSETGASDVGFDEEALYVVVRSAVEDAIFEVIGTLLLLGIAFVVVWVGAAIALSGGSAPGVVAGIAAIAFGFYLGAATLEIIPSVWELF